MALSKCHRDRSKGQQQQMLLLLVMVAGRLRLLNYWWHMTERPQLKERQQHSKQWQGCAPWGRWMLCVRSA
jgi:hypothetical protein